VIADRTIDTSGLSCPIPILKTKKALAEMAAGLMLEVVATDPAAPKDIEAFCRATGNALESSSENAGVYRFFIRRAL
jgi:tRNA 2-thiouridine synthesizing protein A